ncbi:MAG: hypothetical protein ACQEXJ_20110 [Myxococcota bacterium]
MNERRTIAWLAVLTLVLAAGTAACDDDGGDGGSADVVSDTVGGDSASFPDVDGLGDVSDDTPQVEDTPGPGPDAEEDTAGPGPDVEDDTTWMDVTEDVQADVPPVTEELICPELADCAFTACDGLEGQALTDCLADPFATCADPVSAEEATLAEALVTCMGDGACSLDVEDGAHFECQRTKCLAETVACWQTEVVDDTCANLRACIKGCEDPLFGGLEPPCVRDCMNEGDELAVTLFWDLQLCAEAQCADSIEPQVCKDTAITDSLECADPAEECLGNVGAAPGPGKGGGID